MLASILSSRIIPISRALDAAGLDSRNLLRQAGISPDCALDNNARIPADRMVRLWELITAATDDPCFGLEVSRQWHPSSMHALGYAWLASHSLRDGLERIVRYSRVVYSGAQVHLEDAETHTRFNVVGSLSSGGIVPMAMDCTLGSLLVMCQQGCGPGFAPLRVALRRTPPPEPERFQSFFGCPVEFGAAANAMDFRHEDLTAPLPTSNDALARASDQITQDYLSRLGMQDISLQIRTWLLRSLPAGKVSEANLARALHMSSRSLQRKLQEEGLTFKGLLDEMRRELAIQYVRDSRLPLIEITYLLGFSDSSNFSRAFRRWTGISPNAYRVGNAAPRPPVKLAG
jgi:AraC-like DNA-binding protein